MWGRFSLFFPTKVSWAGGEKLRGSTKKTVFFFCQRWKTGFSSSEVGWGKVRFFLYFFGPSVVCQGLSQRSDVAKIFGPTDGGGGQVAEFRGIAGRGEVGGFGYGGREPPGRSICKKKRGDPKHIWPQLDGILFR